MSGWTRGRKFATYSGQIKALGFPRERELDRFAKSVSERARTDLWIDFEAADANPGVLLATGKYGVDSEAVSHIQGKLVSSPQQAQRDGLIERFRTATLPTPQARAVAAEMSLELLGTQVIGNAILAAKVAIHIEGPPRGHTEKLRTAFEEAVARKNDTFRGELRSKLEELRLIRPSRKGMIDRILGGGD